LGDLAQAGLAVRPNRIKPILSDQDGFFILDAFKQLNRRVIACRLCPRLVAWREQVAQTRKAAFAGQSYWGGPLVGFGDPRARLFILGLAPAAHGGNRTGRMFTGDRSGDWLYRALYKAGFANQPTSVSRDDGLCLHDAYVSAVVRCAPPQNKPLPTEREHCFPYLQREFALLKRIRILIALGGFAWAGALELLTELGWTLKPKPIFAHGAECKIGPYLLVGSYHPSQQNTFTGKLTEAMFDGIFLRVKKHLMKKEPRK
jgi:uracil-DNA glycosylase family 4